MRIFALILLAAGAAVTFTSKKTAPYIFKTEINDMHIAAVKSVGFIITLAAVFLVFWG